MPVLCLCLLPARTKSVLKEEGMSERVRDKTDRQTDATTLPVNTA